ncbi:MAG: hypothetical protein QOE59_3310, partial [Actinomycetota bacterium]|nr:hypothetical protein [Actinomycetota bacterium]
MSEPATSGPTEPAIPTETATPQTTVETGSRMQR